HPLLEIHSFALTDLYIRKNFVHRNAKRRFWIERKLVPCEPNLLRGMTARQSCPYNPFISACPAARAAPGQGRGRAPYTLQSTRALGQGVLPPTRWTRGPAHSSGRSPRAPRPC